MRQIDIKLDEDDRVETESLRFGEDWPGFFLRGDDALYVASLISSLYALAGENIPHELYTLKLYADQIFAEVPYKHWIDDNGHTIIEPTMGEKIHVTPSGAVRREIDMEEENGEEGEHNDQS